MTRKVIGRDGVARDGVARDAVPPAPDWRPGTVEGARRCRAEAESLTRSALGTMHPRLKPAERERAGPPEPALAGPALLAREEARLSRRVAGYTPPHLDPGGELPNGPAREALIPVAIDELTIDPATGRDRQVKRIVRKRRGPPALAILPAPLRATAERYAALVEAVGASRGSSLEVSVRAGLSDGGATTRCRLAQRLRLARRTIGSGLVLRPRRPAADPVRPRRVVSTLELVEAVCVRGWSLEALLRRRGWSSRRLHCKTLRTALEAALDRLREVI